MDKAIAGPANRMTNQYTLVNLTISEIDTNELAVNLKAAVIDRYRTLPVMQRFREHKVEIQCEYRDKAGEPVASFLVTPKDL